MICSSRRSESAKVQALLSCVNAPAQLAALAALTGPQEHVAGMRAMPTVSDATGW